jgi:hypothetical protein
MIRYVGLAKVTSHAGRRAWQSIYGMEDLIRAIAGKICWSLSSVADELKGQSKRKKEKGSK